MSLLPQWRCEHERGALERPRGRPKADPREAENAELRRRFERSEAELAKVIEVQGTSPRLWADRLEPGGRAGRREYQAMIEQTVEELTPPVGTRPACRARGAIYRRRRPLVLTDSAATGAVAASAE